MDDADHDLLLLALNAAGEATTAIADVIGIDRGIGSGLDAEMVAGGLEGLAQARQTLRESARMLLDAADVADRVMSAASSTGAPPSSDGRRRRIRDVAVGDGDDRSTGSGKSA